MKFNDYVEISIDLNTSPMHKTEEGFLTGTCCVTCAGVYSYLGSEIAQPPGTYNVLRPIEAIRQAASQLAAKVITNLHPAQFVTPENASKLSVGFTGSNVNEVDGNCFVDETITDKAAIDDVQNKKLVAFSCGYEADLVRQSGVWHGTAYDFVQSNFKYNHIALVPEGRAGDGVRIPLMDGAPQKGHTQMKNVFNDGVILEMEDSAADAFAGLQHQVKELGEKIKANDAAISKAQAERDAAKAEVATVTAKLNDASAIEKAVTERVALLDKARAFGVDVSKVALNDLKPECIKKAFGDAAPSLEGKSADYIDAFFDSAFATVEKKKLFDAKNAEASASANHAQSNSISLADAKAKCFSDGCGLPKKEK